MIDSWIDGVMAAIAGAWMTVLSFFARREFSRIDGKADRDQLERMIGIMEKRQDEYREDQKEAREGRRELHQKFDSFSEKLNETNVQMARLAGRLNGEMK